MKTVQNSGLNWATWTFFWINAAFCFQNVMFYTFKRSKRRALPQNWTRYLLTLICVAIINVCFPWQCLDLSQMTPAFALMKKRNNDLKSLLHSSPKNFTPTERPRSTSYNLGWRRSLAEMDRDYETGVRKWAICEHYMFGNKNPLSLKKVSCW